MVVRANQPFRCKARTTTVRQPFGYVNWLDIRLALTHSISAGSTLRGTLRPYY